MAGPDGRPGQPLPVLAGPAGAVPAGWEPLAGAWLAAGLLAGPAVAAGLGLELLAGLVAGAEPVAALELAVGVGLVAGLGLVVMPPGPGALPG
jgi:hypothetical protein